MDEAATAAHQPQIRIWQVADDGLWRVRLSVIDTPGGERQIESRTVRSYAGALEAAREMMDQWQQRLSMPRIKLEGRIGGFQ